MSIGEVIGVEGSKVETSGKKGGLGRERKAGPDRLFRGRTWVLR